MKNFVFAVLSANFLTLLLLIWMAEHHGHVQLGGVTVKSLDLASLALVAATLVVTGVGVMVAILTLWGYREIREKAVKAAVKKAEKAAIKTAELVIEKYLRDRTLPETTDDQAVAIVAQLNEDK